MKKYILGIIFFCLEVQATELKIYCWDITGSTGESWLQIYETTEFDEHTITWNDRPPLLDLLLDYDSHFSEDAWYSFSSSELTTYVDDVFSRGEPACFVLKCRNQTIWRRVWWFRTKEYFNNRPTLVYQSQTFYPCDDARINEAGPDNNYGTEDRMWACDHGSPQKQASYIEFSAPLSIEEDVQKENLNLLQSAPNPFSFSTYISYTMLPEDAGEKVILSVYDITGTLVRTLVDGIGKPGTHEILWNARNENGEKVPSGLYFYRIKRGDTILTAKGLLVR